MIIESLNIGHLVSEVSCLYTKPSWFESLLTNLEHVSAIGLFILGIFSYKKWQDKIKKEKLETIKIDLVYSLIDLVSTLEKHCYEDPCVSSQSEYNNNIFKKLFSSNEVYKTELRNIDIEITNKKRKFNKYVELFKFYNKPNNKSVENSLMEYRDSIHKFAGTVYFLVMKKYAMYSNTKVEKLRTSFLKYLKKVKKRLKVVLEQYNELLEELKD